MAKHPGGRPSGYSIEIARTICEKIVTTSKGITKLCEDHPEWPSVDTIYLWLAAHKEFSEMYIRAKQHQVQLYVDEIMDISDDAKRDFIETESGIRVDHENINRSRLRVDSRKWFASKLCHRLYGDKIQTETKIDIESMNKDELGKLVELLPADTKIKLIDALISKMRHDQAESAVPVVVDQPATKPKSKPSRAKSSPKKG